jgi:hypothetical protein
LLGRIGQAEGLLELPPVLFRDYRCLRECVQAENHGTTYGNDGCYQLFLNAHVLLLKKDNRTKSAKRQSLED